MIAALAAPLLLASTALAHIQINYPLGQRSFEEETQETGAFCGGGAYSNASAWGLQDAFISLSGDEGQQITVLWAAGSTSAPADVSSSSDFSTTLLANATFPSSGNFCFNVSGLPSSLTAGTIGTLYVQAVGDGANVSSCADVAVIPTLSVASTTVLSADGEEVINAETGAVVSYYDYYCSNSTILALDTCSCHCHGESSHCSDDCSEARVAEADAQCIAEASGTTVSSSAAAASASTPASAAVSGSASSTAAAPASSSAAAAEQSGTSGASSGVALTGLGPLVGAGLVGLAAVLL